MNVSVCFTQFKISHCYKHHDKPAATNPHHTRDLYKMFLYTLFHTVLMFSSFFVWLHLSGCFKQDCGCFCYSWIFSCFVLFPANGKWEMKKKEKFIILSQKSERDRDIKQACNSRTASISSHTHTPH